MATATRSTRKTTATNQKEATVPNVKRPTAAAKKSTATRKASAKKVESIEVTLVATKLPANEGGVRFENEDGESKTFRPGYIDQAHVQALLGRPCEEGDTLTVTITV